jgi:hypothetical protein
VLPHDVAFVIDVPPASFFVRCFVQPDRSVTVSSMHMGYFSSVAPGSGH